MKQRIGYWMTMLIACVWGSYVQAGITQTGSSPASFESLTASTTSLIKNGSPTLLSMWSTDPATTYGAGGVDQLNDGILSNSMDGQALSEADVYQITYSLDTSVNTLGYDISSIRTIAYWGDERRSQFYEVWVSVIGDDSYVYIGQAYYVGAENATSVVVLTPDDNQPITNVDGIRFRIGKFTEFGGSAYSAIEVEGRATPGGIAAGIVATKFSPDSFEYLTASATSLIKSGSATYLNTEPTDPATSYGAGGVAFLNDGILSRSFGEQALCESEYWVRYDLNTSVNTLGYNISSVRTISYWGDGRKYQKYQLYYRTVGNNDFVSLGTFEYTSGAANGTVVMIISDPTVQLLAKNVDGVLFRFFPIPGSGGTTYSDIEVEGSPTLAKVTQAPVFSPDSKNVYGPMPVTMTCGTTGANIYYTINGSVPTISSTRYTGPVTVYNGDILQAIAVGTDTSEVTCRTFVYNPARAELDRGHNRLIEAGLQIHGLVFPVKEDNKQVVGFNLSQFLSANFTTVNLWANPNAISYLGADPGVAWGRVAVAGYIQQSEMPYLSKMVSLQYSDELSIADPQNLQKVTTWIAYMKQYYPNVLVYANQFATQQTVAEMQNYMAAAQPDLVMFDNYPFNGNLTGGSPRTFYEYMQKYRLLGLGGNDGTGTRPIPYALYTQTFVDGPYVNGHIVSESEIRLNNFSAWAFGYTFVSALTYDSCDSVQTFAPIMFNGIDDHNPTAKFAEVAETNRQSRNLGMALVRLLNTDVRMIMGLHGSGTTNTIPTGVTTGISGADTYLTGVSATNLGSTNNGLRGDVIVGFFKPLHETFDGDVYSNQKYFMVTNGLSDAGANAVQTQQRIRLTFNMGTSGITSLQRLSRNTGAIEIVSLTSDGSGIYHLDLVLDGGTGDLFKYNTGAPFVGIENPAVEKIPGDANLDSMVDVGDLGILAANYGKTTGVTWGQGDFNNDGAVDVGDLGILAAHYGQGANASTDFSADYAKTFGTTAANDSAESVEDTSSSICSGLGLPLIAGLALMSLMLVKLEE